MAEELVNALANLRTDTISLGDEGVSFSGKSLKLNNANDGQFVLKYIIIGLSQNVNFINQALDLSILSNIPKVSPIFLSHFRLIVYNVASIMKPNLASSQ